MTQKQKTKQTQQIQTGVETPRRKKKRKKTKSVILKNFVVYLLAAVFAVAFTSYEWVESPTQEELTAKQNYDLAKKERTKALSIIKDSVKGTSYHDHYLVTSKKAKKLFKILTNIRVNQKVFGFDNLQQFLGEFGPFFGFTIYVIFNIIVLLLNISFSKKAMTFYHGTVLAFCLFYMSWIFIPDVDYDKWLYYLMSAFMVCLMLAAANWFLKYRSFDSKIISFLKVKIPILNRDIKHIKDIADHMPANKQMMTYKAMIDVTQEDLQETAKLIENKISEIEVPRHKKEQHS